MPPELAALFAQSGQNFGSGVSSLLGGLFNNSGRPYEKAADVYNQAQNQGTAYQSPFYQAGASAIPQLQQWLGKMQDPSGFINSLMSKYQQSPWASFQMQQGQRSANNAASASGLLGSTPFMQASQDYSRDISSQDMNQWLQNVLGVNTQYGAGEAGLVSGGQTSANALTNLISSLASPKGDAAYGQAAGQNQDRSDIIGGLIKMFTS